MSTNESKLIDNPDVKLAIRHAIAMVSVLKNGPIGLIYTIYGSVSAHSTTGYRLAHANYLRNQRYRDAGGNRPEHRYVKVSR